MALAISYRLEEVPASSVTLGMGCGDGCSSRVDIAPLLRSAALDKQQTLKIKLSCFAQKGADMTRIDQPFIVDSAGRMRLVLRKVWLASNEGDAVCP
jgi:beta-glucosidase